MNSLERHLRNLLRTNGYGLRKDPNRLKTLNHQGGFQIIDADLNLVAGENFEMTLTEVRQWMTGHLLAESYPRRLSGGA